MATPFFPRLRPGATPTAADFNALAEAFAAAVNFGGQAMGDLGVARSLGGMQLLDGREKPHWAKIGERGTGAAYGHTSVAPDGDGTFTDLANVPEYPWGTATDQPAREVNGSEDVEAGTYVRLYPDPLGNGWLFDAGGAAAMATGACALNVRKVDCVAVTGDANTTAVWNTAAAGWRFGSLVATGDGAAIATLVEDDRNRLSVKLASENATWYLNPTGACDHQSAVFRGRYLPLALQDEPADSGSGEDDVVPCDGETIELLLKCVPCNLSCGEIGPLPPTMCAVLDGITAGHAGLSSVYPNFAGAVFSPATLVYGAPYPTPTAGLDWPTSGPHTAAPGFTTWGEPSGILSWVGVGTVARTSPLGGGTVTTRYVFEIYIQDDCTAVFRVLVPDDAMWTGEGPATVHAWVVQYVAGGEWAQEGTGDLPPAAPFPITSTSASGEGVTALAVYSGGCADTGGGGGGAGECADNPGEELESHPDLLLTVPDGPNAGSYTLSYTGGGLYQGTGPGGVPIGVECGNTALCPGGWYIGWDGSSACSTSASVGPIGAVFAGAVAGATGDITLEIAP